jgi:hypothetical protein
VAVVRRHLVLPLAEEGGFDRLAWGPDPALACSVVWGELEKLPGCWLRRRPEEGDLTRVDNRAKLSARGALRESALQRPHNNNCSEARGDASNKSCVVADTWLP